MSAPIGAPMARGRTIAYACGRGIARVIRNYIYTYSYKLNNKLCI